MLYSIKYRIFYYIPTCAQIIIFVHMLLYNKQFISDGCTLHLVCNKCIEFFMPVGHLEISDGCTLHLVCNKCIEFFMPVGHLEISDGCKRNSICS